MSIALQSASSLTHVHAQLNFSRRHLLLSQTSLPNYKSLFSNFNNYSAIIHNYSSIQQPKMDEIIDSTNLRSDFLQALRSRRIPEEGDSVFPVLFCVWSHSLFWNFIFFRGFFFFMILLFCVLSSSCSGAWGAS